MSIRGSVETIGNTTAVGMTNYNMLNPKERPPYASLITDGCVLWEEIGKGRKPVGDCYGRAQAFRFGLSKKGIGSGIEPVFARIRYLSRGGAPERAPDGKPVAARYSDHFITKVLDESGIVFFADSGRELQDVQSAFGSGDLQFPEDAEREVRKNPGSIELYTWQALVDGVVHFFEGMEAIEFARKVKVND